MLPPLGANTSYGAAETFYLADPAQRLELGQAYVTEAATRSRLHRVSFWTTPDSGGPGVDAGFPFAVEDYLPAPP